MKRRKTYQKPKIDWPKEIADHAKLAAGTIVFCAILYIMLEIGMYLDGW